MGNTGRDKHLRANWKTRSPKTEPENPNSEEAVELGKPVSESGVVRQLEVGDGNIVVVANPNPNLDVSGFGKCKEEELEEVMLRNLECLYREAIVTLVRLGRKEDVALEAVLKNGHCYGSMDAMSNIVRNALMYLNGGCKCSDDDDEVQEEKDEDEGEDEECELDFVNLSQLSEYSLAQMVCMLKKIRPEMSKADALWCLLMGDINLVRDSQVLKETCNGESCGVGGNENEENGEGGGSGQGIESDVGDNSEVGFPPGLCKFHGGLGYGDRKPTGVAGMGSKGQCPKRFDLPPPLKEMLNKSVLQPNARKPREGWTTTEGGEEHSMVSSGLKLDVVISMLNNLHEMIDEKKDNNVDSQKEEMIVNLMQKIKELEKQVKERREWAREKAMQAARRLSSDLTELKVLKMEREEETQRLRRGNQSIEDPTKKGFVEMESALRKASGQVDRANAAVRRLENENAEMRAEMEAAKLSASESVKTCLEISKREKKSVKRLLALEKQKTRLQEEISTEKKKIADLRKEIIQVEQVQKVTEAKWKQEIKAKDQAVAHLEELQQTKEAIEAENKRRHEALRVKIEIDFQRHKDDLQRLEQELAHLKLSANPASSPSSKKSEHNSPQEDMIARMLNELDLMDDSSETEVYMNRECILCMKDEVSVIFLPCAHQVICASCNETYGKNRKPTCPCCRTPIHQRICVFGATS